MNKWLLNRIKEKSTWLGIFSLVGLFGMSIEPELRDYIINAIIGVAAVIAFIFREDKYVEKSDIHQIQLVDRPKLSTSTSHSDDQNDKNTSHSVVRDCNNVGVHTHGVQAQLESKDGWNG